MPRIATSRNSKSKSSWPPILIRHYSTGKTAFQVACMMNGKRIRETFKTLTEAKDRAEEIRIARENEGTAALSLAPDQRAEAAKCIALLEPHGVGLRDVTEHYLKHVVVYRTAPSVEEIVDKIISEAQANGRREKTITDLQYRLGRFASAFEGRKLNEIRLDELQEWANDPSLSPRSRRHQLTKVSQLYRFAEMRGWCEKNIAQRLSRPDVEDGEPQFLRVDQCIRLLQHAEEFDLLPYVVLGLFSGIRVAELKRLLWSKVKISERVILIDGSVAKTKSRRVIDLNETALSWLALCAKGSGPVVEPVNLRKRIDALLRAACFGRMGSETQQEKSFDIELEQWPENALRHTCATYSYAATQDAVRVSAMLGNSPDVLHRHYRGLATKSDAERFFALRPNLEAMGKVVPMSATA